MKGAEFDKFADAYQRMHCENIRWSGEEPEFFAEQKVRETVRCLSGRLLANTRVLDFGAGTGVSVPHFNQYLEDCCVTCLDVSKKSLEVGRRRHSDQADFVHFDGQTIPFPEKHFDLVFSACVFHHIDPDDHLGVLSEIRRVLRPGSSLIVFEHNPFNPLTVHAVNTCPFDANAVLVRAKELKARVLAAGFSSAVQRYCVFFPRPLRRLRPLEPYLTWLPLGAQYYVVAEK
jgi:ubiquinone/menaquinone biosynthesis C-methylase UbiE